MWSGIVPVILGGALDDGTVLLTRSGALAEFNTCIMLGSLKSRISTSIPKRFISLRTIYERRQEMNFMQIYSFFLFFPFTLHSSGREFFPSVWKFMNKLKTAGKDF